MPTVVCDVNYYYHYTQYTKIREINVEELLGFRLSNDWVSTFILSLVYKIILNSKGVDNKNGMYCAGEHSHEHLTGVVHRGFECTSRFIYDLFMYAIILTPYRETISGIFLHYYACTQFCSENIDRPTAPSYLL